MKTSLTKTTLRVDGMHCGGCVAVVSAALRRLPTVHVDRAAAGEVTVVRDPRATTYGALVDAVKRAGYQVAVDSERPPRGPRWRSDTSLDS